MSKVLYIKANPKSVEKSITFKMSEAFVQEYKVKNPQDEVIVLDLYKEGIKLIDEQMLQDMFSGKETVMLKYAKQFAEADKYIIADPMWNLGSPAILKAYFDYVMIAGVTFKYTEQGPIGLLSDKKRKGIHIVSRGGKYEGAGAQYEFGDKYLRAVLGFMGITEVETLACELTNVLQGEQLKDNIENSIDKAKKMAREF